MQNSSVSNDLSAFSQVKRTKGRVASVFFESEDATLDPGDVRAIRSTCDRMAGLRHESKLIGCVAELTVSGHTDSNGTIDYNDDLAARRAKSVKHELECKHRRCPALQGGRSTAG